MSMPADNLAMYNGLHHALELLMAGVDPNSAQGEALAGTLPNVLPEHGLGELSALDSLAPQVLGRAARLDAPTALAHMDPPTPWITWATALWNASLNQNMLHAMTSPFASEAEELTLAWLLPYFGMAGGHLCGGSTLANLTALWAARDAGGMAKVIASQAAHVSVEKACRLLGMELIPAPVDSLGRLDPARLPSLDDACLVLTAGTTATGAIDPLSLAGTAGWTHVDAAWAGPLRLSERHAHKLDGIERADSVAVSAHKWFFQPKESALIMFREPARANAAISFGGGYLTRPNVGVQGSRGAAAIPLLATLLAWGRTGLAQRLDHLMAVAESLADAVAADPRLTLWNRPQSAITVFRPVQGSSAALVEKLPNGMFSTCVLDDKSWVRAVAANPAVDIDLIVANLEAV